MNNPHDKLPESTREKIGTAGSEHREKMTRVTS